MKKITFPNKFNKRRFFKKRDAFFQARAKAKRDSMLRQAVLGGYKHKAELVANGKGKNTLDGITIEI